MPYIDIGSVNLGEVYVEREDILDSLSNEDILNEVKHRDLKVDDYFDDLLSTVYNKFVSNQNYEEELKSMFWKHLGRLA